MTGNDEHAPPSRGLSIFERYLTLWVGLCIVGGIVLGNRVSISDYAAVFSHSHSIDDIVDVTNKKTILDDSPIKPSAGCT